MRSEGFLGGPAQVKVVAWLPTDGSVCERTATKTATQRPRCQHDDSTVGRCADTLDPQDMGLGVLPGQHGFKGDALGAATCGLSGRMQSVWSQSGPKLDRETVRVDPLGVNSSHEGR